MRAFTVPVPIKPVVNEVDYLCAGNRTCFEPDPCRDLGGALTFSFLAEL
jgi:hypothetical protein